MIKSIVRTLTILLLLLPATGALMPYRLETAEVSLDSFQVPELLPDGKLLNTYPPADGNYTGQLLLQQSDTGQIFFKLTSFTSPLIGFCGVADSTLAAIKRAALIIPGLSCRTLIFPFHSFF